MAHSYEIGGRVFYTGRQIEYHGKIGTVTEYCHIGIGNGYVIQFADGSRVKCSENVLYGVPSDYEARLEAEAAQRKKRFEEYQALTQAPERAAAERLKRIKDRGLLND